MFYWKKQNYIHYVLKEFEDLAQTNLGNLILLEPGDIFLQKQPDTRKARDFYYISIPPQMLTRIQSCQKFLDGIVRDYYAVKASLAPGNFHSNTNLPGVRRSFFNEGGNQLSVSDPKGEGTSTSGVGNLYESNLLAKDRDLLRTTSPELLDKDEYRDISGYWLSNLEIYEDQLKEYLYDYYQKIDTLFMDSFYNKYTDIMKRTVESHDMRWFAIKKSLASDNFTDDNVRGLLLYSIDEGERLTIYHISAVDFEEFFNI